MWRYVARRAALSLLILLLASIAVFILVRASTDPLAGIRGSVASSERATQVNLIAQEAHRLGLDQPPPAQYLRWLGGFLHGDWGQSALSHESVASAIGSALLNTAQLVVVTVLISAVVAAVIGVLGALHRDSWLDHALTGLSFAGLSMPSFWFALVVIEVFVFLPKQVLHLDDPILYSVGLHSSGSSDPIDYVRHLALPVLVLSVPLIARWSRFQRATMLDVLGAPYMRMAEAKGLTRRQAVIHHGVRNALLPLTTVIALDLGALLGGAIVVETIFSIPGMGQLLFGSLMAGDTTVILPWLMVVAAFVLLCNVAADVLYGVIDPRVRA